MEPLCCRNQVALGPAQCATGHEGPLVSAAPLLPACVAAQREEIKHTYYAILLPLATKQLTSPSPAPSVRAVCARIHAARKQSAVHGMSREWHFDQRTSSGAGPCSAGRCGQSSHERLFDTGKGVNIHCAGASTGHFG